MAQVLEEKPKKTIYLITDKSKKNVRFVWDYVEQKKVPIDEDKMLGISMFNKNLDDIQNQDRIIFPAETEKNSKPKILKEDKDDPTSDVFNNDINPEEAERSIIIDKLKDMIIKFEKQIDRYLDPKIPSGRRNRKIYLQERELFSQNGFKEYIRAIRLKVIALCKYEKKYRMDMFDLDEKGDVKKGWFIEACDDAIENDDFHSAQEVVNAVEQIVLEDTEVVPQRLILTKIK
jgi:hypothetical protein